MSALDPSTYPLGYMSQGGLATYLKCPEMWRRRYIEKDVGGRSGKMVRGSAVGNAEALSDWHYVDHGRPFTRSEVLDAYAEEWDFEAGKAEVDWEDEDPAETKDRGAAALAEYHDIVVPFLPQPTGVERAARLTFPDVDWEFIAYLDLEHADTVIDRKASTASFGQQKADQDLQATAYLATRRAEGNPAERFEFHRILPKKKPDTEVVTTRRTDAQLDAFLRLLHQVAGEIGWRVENDVWHGAPPGAWWCGKKCSYWESCPYGGLYQRGGS